MIYVDNMQERYVCMRDGAGNMQERYVCMRDGLLHIIYVYHL